MLIPSFLQVSINSVNKHVLAEPKHVMYLDKKKKNSFIPLARMQWIEMF